MSDTGLQGGEVSQPSDRTIPERILVSTGVNVSSIERAASLALGAFVAYRAVRDRRSLAVAAAFGVASFAFVRRAYTGHSRLYSSLGVATVEADFVPLQSTSVVAVHEPQRTVTILASMVEVEAFFTDSPHLAGHGLGRDVEMSFSFRPAPHAGTEVQARLTHWAFDPGAADRFLRDFMREAKQLIETGEVARVDDRVHGPRSLRERAEALEIEP